MFRQSVANCGVEAEDLFALIGFRNYFSTLAGELWDKILKQTASAEQQLQYLIANELARRASALIRYFERLSVEDIQSLEVRGQMAEFAGTSSHDEVVAKAAEVLEAREDAIAAREAANAQIDDDGIIAAYDVVRELAVVMLGQVLARIRAETPTDLGLRKACLEAMAQATREFRADDRIGTKAAALSKIGVSETEHKIEAFLASVQTRAEKKLPEAAPTPRRKRLPRIDGDAMKFIFEVAARNRPVPLESMPRQFRDLSLALAFYALLAQRGANQMGAMLMLTGRMAGDGREKILAAEAACDLLVILGTWVNQTLRRDIYGEDLDERAKRLAAEARAASEALDPAERKRQTAGLYAAFARLLREGMNDWAEEAEEELSAQPPRQEELTFRVINEPDADESHPGSLVLVRRLRQQAPLFISTLTPSTDFAARATTAQMSQVSAEHETALGNAVRVLLLELTSLHQTLWALPGMQDFIPKRA